MKKQTKRTAKEKKEDEQASHVWQLSNYAFIAIVAKHNRGVFRTASNI